MASNPDQSTAEEYLAKAKAAEEAAAKATDPILKNGYAGIARAYREMAGVNLKWDDDDATHTPS